ncbi:MAG: hypothetical protein AAB464_01270 [Patescibacteria group bacterium]
MDKLKSLVISHRLLVIVVIIIASFLRLYNITETPPGFYPDEAIYANNGVEAWETGPLSGGLKIFYPENNGREGLWPNIIGFFIVNFGHEPWVSRSVAAVFGILTVLGVYFLTRELFNIRTSDVLNIDSDNFETSNVQKLRINEKIALLATFLMATSFWHILFSRIGFRAIMAPFFLAWGIYFLLSSLNSIKAKSYKLKAILGGIFFGLGFHTYIAYRAMPLLALIIIGYWLLVNKEWQIRKKIILITFLFSLFSLIVFAPLGIYFIQNPQDFFGRTTQVSIFNSESPIKNLSINILKTAGMFNFSGDYNWRHNYAGKPELFWPVGILFIIGIIIGIKNMFGNWKLEIENSENSNFQIIIFSWLIIAALPIVVSNEGLPHALRAILMAPVVFILAGAGGVWLYDLIKNLAIINDSKIKLIILNVSAAIFLTFLIFEAYNSYFIKWGKSEHIQGAFSADYVEIGRELNALPKELPKYVIVEAGGVDVRGIPMPAQTIMFITDTFTPEKQKEKNIYYVLPSQKNLIPENSYKIILR